MIIFAYSNSHFIRKSDSLWSQNPGRSHGHSGGVTVIIGHGRKNGVQQVLVRSERFLTNLLLWHFFEWPHDRYIPLIVLWDFAGRLLGHAFLVWVYRLVWYRQMQLRNVVLSIVIKIANFQLDNAVGEDVSKWHFNFCWGNRWENIFFLITGEGVRKPPPWLKLIYIY